MGTLRYPGLMNAEVELLCWSALCLGAFLCQKNICESSTCMCVIWHIQVGLRKINTYNKMHIISLMLLLFWVTDIYKSNFNS